MEPYPGGCRLIDSGTRCDALFRGSDQSALGAEPALLESGRRIPDDVALVGVDNGEQVISDRHPCHLTTIGMGLAAPGDAATAASGPGPEQDPAPVVIRRRRAGTAVRG
ncbi:substrate-binding domain-containing protein [Streptomyces sp. NPDC001777]|uniref:substrate-binding domain-containing protein n=1 Tax=Streptomyces sp. NPDC001777 TaxID=3364608 RepID=UPI0036BEE997